MVTTPRACGALRSTGTPRDPMQQEKRAREKREYAIQRVAPRVRMAINCEKDINAEGYSREAHHCSRDRYRKMNHPKRLNHAGFIVTSQCFIAQRCSSLQSGVLLYGNLFEPPDGARHLAIAIIATVGGFPALRTRLAGLAVFLAISAIPQNPLPKPETARNTNLDRSVAISFYQE